MESGFLHFDRNHTENFATSLLLLCIEEDIYFRTQFLDKLVARLDWKDVGNLLAWGREECVKSEDDQRRRSDMWLQFADRLLLVEVKTHIAWATDGIAEQLRDQLNFQFRGKTADGVLLLAPRALVVDSSLRNFPTVTWDEVIECASAIKQPSRILELAISHWENTVELGFGLPRNFPLAAMEIATQQTACYAEFLKACLKRIGCRTREASVRFTSGNGHPMREGPWEWAGVIVDATLPDLGPVYACLFHYFRGAEGVPLGEYVELYTGDGKSRSLLESYRFEPPDLTMASLEVEVTKFFAAFENARLSQKA